MAINVYMVFDGDAYEAIRYYEKVFDAGKAEIMTFGEAPPHPEYPLPEEAKQRVMHGRLEINGSDVMFSDTFPGSILNKGDNITLAVVLEDEETLRTQFNRLKEGGVVQMELQETFCSKLYGQVIDRFGISWQFNLGE
ncbi:VOC family protein [Jeotgalibacillus haloalkalitolerans]|uniref:VOC family protein n=1 Tax=Jeotgalibacillus haloalkalitolerans TaxID=3104292 RepID=A0ABU5KI73_9BACL|nr:VOC family protein [Jeotgalibacillus sp. HH7-29]MDZ5710833.1 VOC family protein [Jeotgalibacillus sp. HH7-29]